MKTFKVFVLLLVISSFGVTSSAFADYWNGTKYWGGTMIFTYDASVTSYGYTSIYDDAAAQWRGISSKVSLTKGTHTNADKFYVGTTSIPDRLGLTTGYDSNGTKIDVNDTWHHCTVAIYDNSFDAGTSGHPTPYSRTERLATTIHELGHALKLAHPGSVTGVPVDANSVMVQGAKDYGVQQYDMNQLKAKWGV